MLSTSSLLEGFSSTENFSNDAEMIRAAISAEIDAINFYSQLRAKIKSQKAKQVLEDIEREEKVHIGELEAILKELDEDFEDTQIEGDKEVNSN